MTAPAVLPRLRRAVAEIETQNAYAARGDSPVLAFTDDAIDTVLDKGLASGALHEIAPAAPMHLGAATGFVLALVARIGSRRQALWIRPDYADGEAGHLYGHGLAAFGLALDRMLMLRIAHARDALGAMEEALRCRALGCVVAELPHDGPAADLTATRRLTLAAREGGGFSFLLRHRPSALTSAAQTRWEISSAASCPDRFGGLGRTTFSLSLTKNRRGPTGRWTVAWNHHDRSFSALSLAVARPAADRPARAPFARAG
ncbi:MAG: ImuA family protein [Pseudolabrys sp.]